MSVLSIALAEQPQATETITGGLTVPVRLKAICSSVEDGVLAVRMHPNCPRIGSTYTFAGESSSELVCIGISIEPVADDKGLLRSKVYSVLATYSNQINVANLGEDEENPLDDPPQYEFTFAKYQIPAEYDRDGNPVINGADEKFDPPHLLDENRPIVIVTRNEIGFSAATAVEYQDAVNEDSFAGVAPGVAKMIGISARSATRGSYTYQVVTYEIEFNWKGWNPSKLLAQGYRYRLTEGGKSRQYIDPATNGPPSAPLLLQLNGTESPPVDGVRPHFFHEFSFYREKPFGPLSLGL